MINWLALTRLSSSHGPGREISAKLPARIARLETGSGRRLEMVRDDPSVYVYRCVNNRRRRRRLDVLTNGL